MRTSKGKVDGRDSIWSDSDEPSPKLLIPTHNLVLASLPQSDANRIVASSKPVHLVSGDVVYEDGDDIDHIYFPIDSIISAVAILEDGSSVEISMTGREGIVGMSAMIGGGRAIHWTRVSVAGAALRVPVPWMNEHFRKTEAVHEAVLRTYSGLFTQICQRSVCNVRHTLLQRLCVWLLMMQDRVGASELPFTQEEIANRISVRRAGVSVAASMLQTMHAISYHRGRIVISDPEAVAQTACECYRSLRHEFDENGADFCRKISVLK